LKFAELNLDPSLSSAIQKLNYEECTPIQEQSIPVILSGKDVAGLAQTGTGKTAAFVIPLMDRILTARPAPGDATDEFKAHREARAFKDWKPQNFILILVPTRELAEQVTENVTKLSVDSGLRGFAIYGGTGYDKQKEALKNSVEFIIATPGRLIDLYKEHLVDLKQVRAVVFDEADRMFDMGFKDDMKFILQRIPRERQLLVYSATLNFDVLNTIYQFGSEPVEVNISRDQTKAENVKDQIFHVGNEEKPQHLLSVLKLHNPKQAIIFTNFKMNVEKITKFLVDNGVPAMAISSLLSQAQRNKVIEQFKAENHLNILVATDVAARGLDIKGVDLVINYELPMDSESYVHRIGRTGRAGTEGKAFSFVGDKDVESLVRIEDYLKHKVDVGYLENDQLLTDFKPFPSYHEGSFKRSFDGDRKGGGGGERKGRGDRGPRGDRPERGGGERGERGERPQRAGGQGGKPHHERGPRKEGQNGGGPKRHEGNGPAEYKGASATKREPGSQPRHQQRADGRKHEGQRHGKKPSHASARRQQMPHKGKAGAQKGIGAKVAGFFKKLFGG
jgi:Superfamily II DNA and RNA helicases